MLTSPGLLGYEAENVRFVLSPSATRWLSGHVQVL